MGQGGSAILVARKYLKKLSSGGSFLGSHLVINEGGEISPKGYPSIALGFGDPPIFLVPRDSPNRVILQYGSELKHNMLPQVGYDPITDQSKIFSFELRSHPGQSIVRSQRDVKVGKCTMNSLRIGPIDKGIKLSHDGRILACANTGLVMKVPTSEVCAGSILILYKETSKSATIAKGEGCDFTINDDGSISPLNAPHLAIGTPIQGNTNNLVSAEQKALAESEARRNVNQKKTGSILKKLGLR